MITLGAMEIHIINDCIVQVDPGGAFGLVPRVLWSKVVTPDENGLLPMAHHNLVIKTGGQVIVVDTGFGEKLTPKLRKIWGLERPTGDLVAGLARLDIAPADVDIVIDTHLHGDHCGGNTRYADDGSVVATFPNASYVVQRQEFEDAMQPNERTRATYLLENYEPLMQQGQLRLLDGEREELAPGVTAIRTPGHTPGMLTVLLESGGQSALFVSDMATYAVHFVRLGWLTAYDVEPLINLETKRQWQRWAIEHDALLIFPHDTQIPAGRLRLSENGKPTIEPVTVVYS